MNFNLDLHSNLPAYIQLYQFLRQDIINAVYPYGSKLPSRRVLAAETGLSLITVIHAIDLLCDEGYVEARERSGYFVIFKLDDFQVALPPVTTSQIAIPQSHSKGDFPFSVMAKTMRRVILDYNEKILTKSPNQGCLELRTELCAYLARSRNIYVQPQQLVIGSGAEYLYGLIAQLLGKENIIAIEEPCYEKIKKVYTSLGIKIEPLTLHADGIDSTELWHTQAKVLHTTPFNSFPSGVSVASPKKHEYLLWAEKNQAIIVEDNYDSELTVATKAEDSLFLMSNGKNVIYLNTFSRTIAPSIRMGYMLLPPKLVDIFQQRLGFYSCTVPVFDQYVLAELLHNGDFERHVNRIRRKKRKAL